MPDALNALLPQNCAAAEVVHLGGVTNLGNESSAVFQGAVPNAGNNGVVVSFRSAMPHAGYVVVASAWGLTTDLLFSTEVLARTTSSVEIGIFSQLGAPLDITVSSLQMFFILCLR